MGFHHLWRKIKRQRAATDTNARRSEDADFDARWAELEQQTSEVVRDLSDVLAQRAKLHARQSKLESRESQPYQGKRRNGGAAPTAT